MKDENRKLRDDLCARPRVNPFDPRTMFQADDGFFDELIDAARAAGPIGAVPFKINDKVVGKIDPDAAAELWKGTGVRPSGGYSVGIDPGAHELAAWPFDYTPFGLPRPSPNEIRRREGLGPLADVSPYQAPETVSVDRALLDKVLEFLDDEAENRGAAGSDMSDYEREPRELSALVGDALGVERQPEPEPEPIKWIRLEMSVNPAMLADESVLAATLLSAVKRQAAEREAVGRMSADGRHMKITDPGVLDLLVGRGAPRR